MRLSHPRDAFLTHDPIRHIYTYRNNDGATFQFPNSASAVSTAFFPLFDSTATAKRCISTTWTRDDSAYKPMIDYMRNSRQMDDDSIISVVTEAWRASGTSMARAGISLHAEIERVLNSDAIVTVAVAVEEEIDDAPPREEEGGFFDTMLGFLTTSSPFRFRRGEERVWAKAIASFAASAPHRQQQQPRINHAADVIPRLLALSSGNEPEMAAWKAWRATQSDRLALVRTEWSIYSLDYKIAGQIDALFYDIHTQQYVLVDWKRVHGLGGGGWRGKVREPFDFLPDTKHSRYAVQLNVYAYILRTCYRIAPSRLIIVQIAPDDDEHEGGFVVKEHEVGIFPDSVIERALTELLTVH